MAKEKLEYEGVAYTSAMSKDGWQVSVTERAKSSAEAVSNLEATIALMAQEGYVPFVSYYNKAPSVVGEPQDVLGNQDDTAPVTPAVDPRPDVSVVEQAVELGGVVTNVVGEPQGTVEAWIGSPQAPPPQAPAQGNIVTEITDEDIQRIVRGISPYDDGTNFLGVLPKKPLVAECLGGDSYEIEVDSYEVGKDKIEFYNRNSQYAAVAHSLVGKGGQIFSNIFPGWEPKEGDHGPIEPVLLYVVGEGQTSRGNAWQNLKAGRKAV